MSLTDEDLEKLELAKIFNEINQLQNQRFTLTLAALTFVGVSGGWMFQANDLTGCYLLATTVSLMLVALSYWLVRLGNQVVRLSVYLEVRFQSQFEKHHAKFSLEGHSNFSQTRTQFQLIASFGVLTCILPFVVWLTKKSTIEASVIVQPAFFGLLASAVLLAVVIFLFAQKNRTEDRESLRRTWANIVNAAQQNAAPDSATLRR